MKKENIFKQICSPFFIGCLLTALFLFPIIVNINDHLYSYDDGLFIAWTIDQVAKKISSGENFYQLPILSDYENTLTFSDPFFPTTLLSIPLKLFTNNIVLIHNLHLILSSIIAFLSVWLLTKFLYKSNFAALISAVIFNFSSMHLRYLVHFQIFSLAGLVLSILFFYKWIKDYKVKYLLYSALFFLYQTLNAPETGFFLSAIFFLIFLSQDKIRAHIFKNLKTVIPILFFTLFISILFYYPYFISAQTLNSQRSIRDAAHFSANLTELFSVELLLFFTLLFFLWKKTPSNKEAMLSTNTLILIGLTGATLMLGPVLKINNQTVKILNLPIPLPYVFAYYLIPGFQAFRATSRWIILLNFSLSLLLGKMISQFKIKPYHQLSLFLLLTSFLFFIQINRHPVFKIDLTPPPIYQLLKYYPGQTLLELPAYTWDIKPLVSHESLRLLYQSGHHLTLFNGTSGFVPSQREKEFHLLTTHFPDDESLNSLIKYRVKLILVNFDQYFQLKNLNFFNSLTDINTLHDKINKQTRLEKISCDPYRCLYLLKK